MTLELRLTAMGFECWLDQKMEAITTETMQQGVRGSEVFLLFLSKGVLTRPFCIFEIKVAFSCKKVRGCDVTVCMGSAFVATHYNTYSTS